MSMEKDEHKKLLGKGNIFHDIYPKTTKCLVKSRFVSSVQQHEGSARECDRYVHNMLFRSLTWTATEMQFIVQKDQILQITWGHQINTDTSYFDRPTVRVRLVRP